MTQKNVQIRISAKDEASGKLSAIGSRLSGVIAGFATSIGVATSAGIAFGIKSASALEQTNIAFQNIYGSSEKAGATIKELVKFAEQTPFEMPEIADMALKLKNVAGITDKELIPTLTRLGDIASSQGKSISQTTEAYLDAITGEFERLKEFGITAKQNGDMVALTFRGQTMEVAKTSEGIGNYLAKIAEMDGIQGGMIMQSKTLNGLYSTFKDTVSGLARNIVGLSDTGEILEGGLMEKLKVGLAGATQWISDNKVAIMEWATAISSAFQNTLAFVGEIIKQFTTGGSGDFGKFMQDIMVIVQDGLRILGEFLAKHGEDIKLVISTLASILGGILGGFFKNIMPVIESGLAVIGGLFEVFATVVRGDFSSLYADIQTLSVEFLKLLGNIIKLGLEVILGIFGTNTTKMAETFWNMGASIQKAFEGVKGFTIEIFTSMYDFIFGKIQSLVEFINNTVGMLQKASDKVSSFGNEVKNAIMNAPVNIGTAISGARADGGPVSSGKTYLVGERGPELFTPGASGFITPNSQSISINLGGVTINNSSDETRLIERIKQELAQTAKRYNQGIS